MRITRRTFVTALGAGALTLGAPATSAQSGRTTVNLGMSEDATRYSLLYAIQKGIVTSDKIDLEISLMTFQAAAQAYQTKQYDIIESAPTQVPPSLASGFKILLTSTGLETFGGTPVVVRADSDIQTAADLKGKTIGVPSFFFALMIPLRYVLQEKFGLNADMQSGDVRWQEVPPDLALSLVGTGKLDAALLFNFGAWKAETDPSVRAVMDAAADYNDLTKSTYIGTVFVSYPEIVEAKKDALIEANRMLRESAEYFHANVDAVAEVVAKEHNASADFVRWWADHYLSRQGSLNADDRAKIQTLWNIGHEVGAIKEVPKVDDLAAF